MPHGRTTPQDPAACLLLGAGGMLGRAWTENLRAAPPAGGARALTRSECDITDASDVRRAITRGVSLVINCAAWTDVDGAEADEAGALRLNADAVALLADRCRDVGATLVHYSTDYVFDGAADAAYPIDAPRAPINAYGRSKAAGEDRLEQSGADCLIIRTSWLYAAHGGNFLRTIARLCREKPTLRVVADQVGRPTSCDSLVGITRRLLDADARGIHHGCNAGRCAWHGFASAIAARVNPACIVEPCGSEEYPRPAPRPASSVLDLSVTESLIGPLTPWTVALDRTLDRLLEQDCTAVAGRRGSTTS